MHLFPISYIENLKIQSFGEAHVIFRPRSLSTHQRAPREHLLQVVDRKLTSTLWINPSLTPFDTTFHVPSSPAQNSMKYSDFVQAAIIGASIAAVQAHRLAKVRLTSDLQYRASVYLLTSFHMTLRYRVNASSTPTSSEMLSDPCPFQPTKSSSSLPSMTVQHLDLATLLLPLA